MKTTKNIIKASIASTFLFAALLLSGCATFQDSYPAKISGVKKDLKDNKASLAQKTFTSSFGEKSKNNSLYLLEQARLAQLNADPKQSLKYYANIITNYQTNLMKAKIQISKILENTGSVALNDRELPYEVPDYAMTFVYAYQALNYLSLHDLNNALVSIRQLSNAQAWIKQQQDFAKQGQNKINNDYSNHNISQEKLGLSKSAQITSMLDQAKGIQNAYENGFSYYLASIMYAADSDYNNAMVSIKDAKKMLPKNNYVLQTYTEIEKGFNGTNPLANNHGRLIVLYEPGFVAAKKSFELTLFLGNLGLQKFNMPYYTNDQAGIHPTTIRVSKQGKSVAAGQSELLVNTTAMALKSLSEQYPAIITREILRIIFKSTITAVAANNKDQGAATLGLIAGSIYSYITAKTDQRSWLLLPNSVQLYEKILPIGKYQIKVGNTNQSIKINNAKTTLLWVVQIGLFNKVYSFQL